MVGRALEVQEKLFRDAVVDHTVDRGYPVAHDLGEEILCPAHSPSCIARDAGHVSAGAVAPEQHPREIVHTPAPQWHTRTVNLCGPGSIATWGKDTRSTAECRLTSHAAGRSRGRVHPRA